LQITASAKKFLPLAVVNDGDGFTHVPVGLVDVTENAHLKSACFRIVLFFSAIVASVVQQLLRFVKPAYPRQMWIHGFVVGNIFPVVNGGALDVTDGVVNFVNGIFFLLAQFAAVGAFQQAARKTQIGERVQVGGMFSLRLDLICDRQKYGDSKNEKGESEKNFHGDLPFMN
jgi:hypothetical protein